MEINDAANNINHLDLHVQCQTFCVIVTKYVVSRQIFIKDHNTKFHSFSVGTALMFVVERTAGRTDRFNATNRRLSRLCKSTWKSYMFVPTVSFFPCAIDKPSKNFCLQQPYSTILPRHSIHQRQAASICMHIVPVLMWLCFVALISFLKQWICL